MNSAAPARTVDAQKLQTLVADIFSAEGVPEQDAARIAECLVLADLRGVASHGVSRLSIYLERLRRGMVERVPEFGVSEPSPVAALLDELIRQRPASAKGRYLTSVTVSTSASPGIPLDPSKSRDLLEDED